MDIVESHQNLWSASVDFVVDVVAVVVVVVAAAATAAVVVAIAVSCIS